MEREGKRICMGCGKIQIERKWWKWDEIDESLKDISGRLERRRTERENCWKERRK